VTASGPSRSGFSDVRRTRLLRPRPPLDTIARPGLLDRLNAGLDHSLVLLATPAGYGKTTLLSEWAARCPVSVAWLSMDEHGDDLQSFTSHLVAAVQMVVPDVGQQTLNLFNRLDPPSRVLAAVFEDDLLDLTDDVALVIDDYHLVGNQSIHGFIAALLEHPLPGFHLYLATRTDPPLPLTRLRLHGRMTELRAANLRFTTEEAVTFLERSTQLALDHTTAALIEQWADGWAAGLRLAALSLHEGASPDAVLAAFESRRLRGLMESLVGEILDAQPADIQQFLLRTSIAERITAPLAAALLDSGASEEEAAATLDRVVRAGLFLSPLEADPRWHQYHALFRAALRGRLRAVAGGDAVRALHARASAWHDEHGLIEDAIQHARAAGDDEAAALIVERQTHLALNRDDLPALESWLRLLPEAMLKRRPELILGQAWVAYVHGRWALHRQLFDAAEASLDIDVSQLRPARMAALRGEIEAMRSMLLLDAGDGPGAAEAARRALELVPITHRYVLSMAHHQLAFAELLAGRADAAIHGLRTALERFEGPPDLLFARLLLAKARIHDRSGNLQESRQFAADARRLASERGYLSCLSWATYQIGSIDYELNDLDSAEELFSSIIADPYRAHTTPLRDATFGLALIHQARGRHGEASVALSRLREFFSQSANMQQVAFVHALQSHFLRHENMATEPPPDALGPGQRQIALVGMLGNPGVIRARALLHDATAQSFAQAETLLGELLVEAQRLHFLRGEVEILALQSVLGQARGHSDDAAVMLERALDRAARSGYIRTFLDCGPLLAAALRALRPRSQHAAYVDRLLAAFAAEAPTAGGFPFAVPSPPPVDEAVDSLTERELEILERLAARLSYKEIAEALVISPFTVKAHASNIYGKLGVSGRREAITSARARGLIA
jgi:LuxR family maltose regulon positive regulatory protein